MSWSRIKLLNFLKYQYSCFSVRFYGGNWRVLSFQSGLKHLKENNSAWLSYESCPWSGKVKKLRNTIFREIHLRAPQINKNLSYWAADPSTFGGIFIAVQEFRPLSLPAWQNVRLFWSIFNQWTSIYCDTGLEHADKCQVSQVCFLLNGHR